MAFAIQREVGGVPGHGQTVALGTDVGAVNMGDDTVVGIAELGDFTAVDGGVKPDRLYVGQVIQPEDQNRTLDRDAAGATLDGRGREMPDACCMPGRRCHRS